MVAGGTTLYEACALGTPVVAVPVVSGQTTTVRRFVRAGLVVGVPSTAGVGTDAWSRAAAVAARDSRPTRRAVGICRVAAGSQSTGRGPGGWRARSRRCGGRRQG